MPQFIALPSPSGWSRSDIEGDAEMLEEIAREMNEDREAGMYFVCALLPDEDKEHHLYRVETDNPLEILESCEVGSHGAESYGDSLIPSKVLDQLIVVHARNPIVPFFADPAGFKCGFEKPLSEEFAAFLDEAIFEGVEAYADEEEGLVSVAVLREGCLRLWWD